MVRGQLKIQQMAFMLIALTLFFVLVGMFIIVVKFSSLKESATELQNKETLLLVTKLANSPEFSCGESFGTGRTNCVDADKLMALKENSEVYLDFWGVSNIEVRKIYPPQTKEIECNNANYPNCNLIRIKEGEVRGFYNSNFVSLCRKEQNENSVETKCEMARLLVSYEEAE